MLLTLIAARSLPVGAMSWTTSVGTMLAVPPLADGSPAVCARVVTVQAMISIDA
jgi:hypothetical protein